MKELNTVIADNIADLRKKAGLTQLLLAEKLNYSDKAVSKWERGESLPDISVLKQIADFFSVSVDYLLCEEHASEKQKHHEYTARQRHNRRTITLISVVLVWFIATFAFLNIDLFRVEKFSHWLVFIYAVPASSIVTLVFNSIWGNRRRNFLIVSVLVWGILLSVYLTLLVYGFNIWQLFLLGIPGQVIICLWSRLKRPENG